MLSRTPVHIWHLWLHYSSTFQYDIRQAVRRVKADTTDFQGFQKSVILRKSLKLLRIFSPGSAQAHSLGAEQTLQMVLARGLASASHVHCASCVVVMVCLHVALLCQEISARKGIRHVLLCRPCTMYFQHCMGCLLCLSVSCTRLKMTLPFWLVMYRVLCAKLIPCIVRWSYTLYIVLYAGPSASWESWQVPSLSPCVWPEVEWT